MSVPILKRLPGRPPLDASSKSTDVHLTLPERDYDRIDQIARHRRISVPEVIRHSLKHLLTDERGA